VNPGDSLRLDSGATLEFEVETVPVTVDVNFAGAGSLIKTGGEELILSGANTYTGATTVKAGTLALSGSGTISRQLVLYGGATFDTGLNTVPLDRFEVYGQPQTPARWIGGALDAQGAALNFYVPSTAGNGDTLLTLSGTVDLTGAVVNVGVEGSSTSLSAGTEFILIDADTPITGNPANATANGVGMQGITLRYNFEIRMAAANQQLLAILASSSRNPATDALPNGPLSGLQQVGRSVDQAASGGASAAREALRSGKTTFVYLEGERSHHDTGPGANLALDSTLLMAGIAGERKSASGELLLTAFLTHGQGNYDSRNRIDDTSRVKGRGDIEHTGLGLLARFDATGTDAGHPYVETSLQGGRVKNDFRTDDLAPGAGATRVTYDSSSNYQGAHLAAGYVWKLAEQGELDLYGRLLYARRSGDTVILEGAGDELRFKSVESKRLRIGGRYTWVTDTKVRPYVGLAWEHEFDGKARATITPPNATGREKIPPAKMKGGAGILELGLTLDPGKTQPMKIDLGLQGHAGKREGVSGSVKVEYRF
jgi:outer membrane autotransporter protein